MKFGDLLLLSINNLKRRKLRTFLTVLGVIIGTASIIVMVSLGIGQSELQTEMISSYASLTTVTVYGGENAAYMSSDFASAVKSEPKYIKDETIESFKRIPHVTGASPVLSVNVVAKQGAYENSYLRLQGVSREYLEKIPLGAGELPPAGNQQLQFIYGNMVLRDFSNAKTGEGYWDTGEDPDVDLMNRPVFIIFDVDKYWQTKQNNTNAAGMEDTGSTGDDSTPQAQPPKKYIVPTAGLVEGTPDDYNQYSYGVYCDVDALKAQLKTVFRNKPIPGQPTTKKGKPYNYFTYDQAEVYVDDMSEVKDVQAAITAMGFQANSNMEWVESNQKSMRVQQAVLGGIGAVSLLVAAIGIANTMMMSIYERTKEIGVMKVLGCNMDNIRDMFLIESGFIGLMGGVVGMALSFGISAVINFLYQRNQMMMGVTEMTGNISRIPLWLVGLALIFAIVVGMAAGFFPSRRAMKLSPLAAIRND